MADLISRLLPARQPRNAAPPVHYVGAGSQGGTVGTWLGGSSGPDRGTQIESMTENGSLFGVIDRLAESTASDKHQWHLHSVSPGVKCERCGEEGFSEVAGPHPVLDLWNRPNEFFTGALLRETGQQHYDLVGELYWVVVKDMFGLPTELWPVRPDRMNPVKDQREYLLGWVYIGPDGEKVPLLRDQVIQSRRPDPADPYRGISPLSAIAPELRGARLAAEWNARFFENSAVPGGVIEFQETLDDVSYERFVDRWRAAHQGVNNAHRVGIIEMGKWVNRTFTHKDMEFGSMATITGDRVREVFGFPKFAAGIVDDVNRATAEASDDFFAGWLIVPRLDRMRSAANAHLLPMFGTLTIGLTLAYVSPVQGDVEGAAKVLLTRAQAFTQLVSAGVTPAEAADACGLPGMGLDSTRPVASPREVAELVQKIYLGVGKVVTWQEAREVLVSAGVPLDLSEPAPEPPAPAGGGFGRPAVDGPADRALVRVGFLQRITSAWHGDVLEGELVAGEAPPHLQRVQVDWERALDALLREWNRDVAPALDDALLQAVEDVVASGDPVRLAVLDLSVDASQAVTIVERAMLEMADLAARRVAEEARDAGVTDLIHGAAAVRNAAADFAGVAAAAVGLIITAYGNGAGTEALRWIGSGRQAGEIRGKVREWMRGLAGSNLRARLGGLLTRAQNAGRIATLAANANRARWFANETLDGNTCKPCKNIDGQELPTVDAMITAYGGGGGYLFCEGRERCRGTVDARWEVGNDGA